jgi:alanine dehydrogenase
MTRDHVEFITRFLHVANAPTNVQDRNSSKYDKLHKVRWMLDEVQSRFQAMWSSNQQITVDEGMIIYKGN